MKNRSNFTLIFAFQVQMYRSMLILVILWIEIIQTFHSEMSGHSPDCRRGTVQLSLV